MHTEENKTAGMILKQYYLIFNVEKLEFKPGYRTGAVCVKMAGKSVFSPSGFANSSLCVHISAFVATTIESLSQLLTGICQLKFYLQTFSGFQITQELP